MSQRANGDDRLQSTLAVLSIGAANERSALATVRVLVEEGRAAVSDEAISACLHLPPPDPHSNSCLNGVLHWAVQYGRLSIVEYLADRGATLGTVPVADACMNGKLSVLRFLRSRGCTLLVGPRTVGGATEEVSFAQMGGHDDVVQFLVQECNHTVNRPED